MTAPRDPATGLTADELAIVLAGGRVAISTADLPPDFIELLRDARTPPEQDYDCDEDGRTAGKWDRGADETDAIAMRERAASGNPEAALRILADLPSEAPEPGDEMPD